MRKEDSIEGCASDSKHWTAKRIQKVGSSLLPESEMLQNRGRQELERSMKGVPNMESHYGLNTSQ